MKSLAMLALLVAAVVGLAYAAPAHEKTDDFDRMVKDMNEAPALKATASDGTKFVIKPAVPNIRDYYPAMNAD